MHHETKREEKVSCLFSSSRSFPEDTLPASCAALAPFRLCSRSQPQSSPLDPTSEAGAPALSPHPPQQVSRQASWADECWPALILVQVSLHFALHTLVAVLSSVAPKLPLSHPPSPPVKGLPSVWRLFLLHSSLPEVQFPSLLFCLFSLFTFSLTMYMGSFLPFRRSEFFCQHSVGVL